MVMTSLKKLPKRSYENVSIQLENDGWAALLDGKLLKTPKQAEVVLPTEKLAEAIRAEFEGQGAEIDPATMPMTTLAYAVMDQIMPYRDACVETCAAYGETDLLYYRAEEKELADLQETLWEPVLAWARQRYDVTFVTTTGLMPVEQPPATRERLKTIVNTLNDWELVVLDQLTHAFGSLLLALSVMEGRLSQEDAFAASIVDDAFQMARWGEEEEKLHGLRLKEAHSAQIARFWRMIRE